MSSRLHRRSVFDRGDQRSGPMMTPMVDVVLVILIFFMASTTIAGYEWFLHATVESPDQKPSPIEQARFVLPAAVIDVDLVFSQAGITQVYGISGDVGLPIDQAIAMISEMDPDAMRSLKVGIGAADGVPMGDVMAIHDAWHSRGVPVILRASR